MVLREQSEDGDQMNTAGEPVILIPETLLKWEPTLKERGGFCRQIFTEEGVMTASRDSWKGSWHNQSPC